MMAGSSVLDAFENGVELPSSGRKRAKKQQKSQGVRAKKQQRRGPPAVIIVDGSDTEPM
jgi:hypothetical protein